MPPHRVQDHGQHRDEVREGQDEVRRHLQGSLGVVGKGLAQAEHEGGHHDPHGRLVAQVDGHQRDPSPSGGDVGHEGRQVQGHPGAGQPAGEAGDQDAGQLVGLRPQAQGSHGRGVQPRAAQAQPEGRAVDHHHRGQHDGPAHVHQQVVTQQQAAQQGDALQRGHGQDRQAPQLEAHHPLVLEQLEGQHHGQPGGQQVGGQAGDEDVGLQLQGDQAEQQCRQHGAGDAQHHPQGQAAGQPGEHHREEGPDQHEPLQGDVEHAGQLGVQPAGGRQQEGGHDPHRVVDQGQDHLPGLHSLAFRRRRAP